MKIKKRFKTEYLPGKPYLLSCSFGFSKKVNEIIKVVPGVTWSKETGWVVPIEVLDILTPELNAFGYEIEKPVISKYVSTNESKLYEYQKDTAAKIIGVGSDLVSFDLGLGKTATAIEAMRYAYYEKPVQYYLVVCLASVRENWKREIEKWWVGNPYDVHIVYKGKEWPAIYENCKSKIVITSFDLLPEVGKVPWSFVVVDESHHIKNPKSKRTTTMISLRDHAIENNYKQIRVCLTASPIADNPKDLIPQLDFLYPGRFKTDYKFLKRYCNEISNAYGTNFVGLNEDNAEELNIRLKSCASRVTRSEVSHLIPPVNLAAIYVNPEGGFDLSDLNFEDDVLSSNADKKVKTTLDLIEEAWMNGKRRFVIFSHLRETAKKFVDEIKNLGNMPEVILISGDVDAKTRDKELQKLDPEGEWIVSATLGAAGTGIDAFANAQFGVFSELSYYPVLAIQALGRFGRLSTKEPTDLRMLILSGTKEEEVSYAVKKKVEDINKVIKAGVNEEKLESSFRDDPNFADRMERIEQFDFEIGV